MKEAINIIDLIETAEQASDPQEIKTGKQARKELNFLMSEIKDLRLRLSAALQNTIIYKCHSCEGYYNQGWICSCGRDNSYSDKEWKDLQEKHG